jgi:predicted nucleic acid-binding Zn ribbon protein
MSASVEETSSPVVLQAGSDASTVRQGIHCEKKRKINVPEIDLRRLARRWTEHACPRIAKAEECGI